MTDRVFRYTPVVKHIGDVIRADIVINSSLVGNYYLWVGIAQGEKFTYESGFIPIKLPTVGPVAIEMHPSEPISGLGDLVTMILSSPDWMEEHRLIRTVALNAYDLR